MWRITFLDQRKLFCCRLLNFSLRHKTTPRGVVISQISMKSFTRFHGGEICLIKNQVCKEYNLLLLNSILSLCVCVCVYVCMCVFEWIIAIVFVYTCVVTICRRRYGHVSTAFRIPWIVYRTRKNYNTIHCIYCNFSPSSRFLLIKISFFLYFGSLVIHSSQLEKLYLDPHSFIFFLHFSTFPSYWL